MKKKNWLKSIISELYNKIIGEGGIFNLVLESIDILFYYYNYDLELKFNKQGNQQFSF